MEKIKVDVLREHGKLMKKENKIVEIGDMKVDVKQYLPVLDKAAFAMRVYNAGLSDEDLKENKHIIDSALVEVFYANELIRRYTNLTLPKDQLEAYDLIISSGIYDLIVKEIDEKELVELRNTVMAYINKKVDQDMQEYNTGRVLQAIIGGLASAIPTADEMKNIFSALSEGQGAPLDYTQLKEVVEKATESPSVDKSVKIGRDISAKIGADISAKTTK